MLVDPFDSERDLLSKIYILTTSAPGGAAGTGLEGSPTQQQQSKRYLFKVFPDRTPFRHAATTTTAATSRTDPKNKASMDKELMKKVVQDAIEHELGAMAWAEKFLTLTTPLKLIGHAFQGGRLESGSEPDTTGLEMFGILGFLLMEFPEDGILYRAPSEEYRAPEAQQLEISERLAEMLSEMRSTSSVTVSGFSTQPQNPLVDGSNENRVTKPYSRFDLIVDALRWKDAEKAEQEVLNNSILAPSPNGATSGEPSSRLGEAAATAIDNNTCFQLGHGATAAEAGRWSDMTMTSRGFATSPASSSFTSLVPPLSPARSGVQSSRLSELLQIKEVECHRVSYKHIREETPLLPPLLSPAQLSPVAGAVDASPVNDGKLSSVDASIIQSQDSQRQANPQDDLLTFIAKRLVNATPPPRDALEFCKRLSQAEHESYEERHQQNERPPSMGLGKLQNLAVGTMRRLDIEKTKIAVRPLSIPVDTSASNAGLNPARPVATPVSATSLSPPKSPWPVSPSSLFSSPPSPCTLRRRSLQQNQFGPCFDAEPSVYCSARARETHLDGRGDICRLLAITVTDNVSTLRPSSFLAWPKEFADPMGKNKDGQIIFSSVAEFEYVRLINALVALERLDSTPGSMCRFPRELLELLPRILRLVYEKDILFTGPNTSSSDQQQIPLASPVLRPPGLFEGVDSVFTHGQLSMQPSLVTNRRRRGIMAVTNFQKAGFLPPYDEDIRGMFVKKVYSSFWNVPSAYGDDDDRVVSVGEGGGAQGGQGGGAGDDSSSGKVKGGTRKTLSILWPFKRKATLTAATTTTYITAPATTSTFNVTQDRDDDEDEAKSIMPTRSIPIHGRHPVPYPLLNHIVEDGISCGNQYMVLVDANRSPTTSTSAASTSPSIDSFITDSSSPMVDAKRSSDSLSGFVCQTVATPATSGASPTLEAIVAGATTVSDGSEVAKEKSGGSFRRMKNRLKAQFQFKKNKNNSNHDNTQHPSAWAMEVLIDDPAASNGLFSLSAMASTTVSSASTAAVAPWPTSAAPITIGRGPPQLPPLPFMAELPTFHSPPSSLSLSLSLPNSINSTRSIASQVTLLPEASQVCQVGWSHFLNTYCALETLALEREAVTRTTPTAAETLAEGIAVAGRVDLEVVEPWCTSNAAFVKIKDANHAPKQQQPQETTNSSTALATASSSSATLINPSAAAEALVSITKTLQNLVVALEAGGIVLTPDQLLAAISNRQQIWRQREDERLERIETERQTLRDRRLQAELPDHILTAPSGTVGPSSPSPTLANASSSGSGNGSPPGSAATAMMMMPTTTTTKSTSETSLQEHEHTHLHHKLGTLIAPTLPVYGIRLTSQDGKKTLAQVETERIEREMHAFWKGLEALCESDPDVRPPPPGIALLSLHELSKNVDLVEHYVSEMEARFPRRPI
ncbi:hypothetical protein BGX24_009755 [Mortierella sp. AD032]|nr:hypothetical protein BGX24_009755 [Mortierella sp. AD032]